MHKLKPVVARTPEELAGNPRTPGSRGEGMAGSAYSAETPERYHAAAKDHTCRDRQAGRHIANTGDGYSERRPAARLN